MFGELKETPQIALWPLKLDEVHFDLKRPCDDCPFVKGVPLHDGVCKGLPGLMDALETQQFAHTCHKTDPRADGPVQHRSAPAGGIQHCAGAILMVLKTGFPYDIQHALVRAHDRGDIDLMEWVERAKSDSKVYTVQELCDVYRTYWDADLRAKYLAGLEADES